MTKENQPQVTCRLDQQQCQQECEHKSNRSECPFVKPENQTLLDKAKKYAEKNYQQFWDVENINELYKAYLAGAGENNGLKWVKSNEQLPKDCWQGKFRLIDDQSLKEYFGMFQLQNEYVPSNRFIVGGRTFSPIKVEWLSESSPVNEEREKELESISGHNRAIIKDLNEQRLQLAEKDARIKELEEALRKIIGIGPDDNERDFIIAAARYIQESKSLAQQALHEK